MKICFFLFSLMLTNALMRPIINNCLIFNEAGQCVECKTLHFLVDQRCRKKFQLDHPKCFNCRECVDDICIQCEDSYELEGETCVVKPCPEYKNCSYCDEDKCLFCNAGFSLSKSLCIEDTFGNGYLPMYILCPIVLALLIVGFVLFKAKFTEHKPSKASPQPDSSDNKAEEDKRVNEDKVLAAQNVNGSFNAINHSFNSIHENPPEAKPRLQHCFSLNEKGDETCVKCDSKKITITLDCGCKLCFIHFLEVAKQSIKTCTIHNAIISTYYLKQHFDFNDNFDNEIVIQKETICTMCKEKVGFINLECGCGARLCNSCFSELIVMVNYYQCPACNAIITKYGK